MPISYKFYCATEKDIQLSVSNPTSKNIALLLHSQNIGQATKYQNAFAAYIQSKNASSRC